MITKTRLAIEAALTIFPPDVVRWNKSRFGVDIDESESWCAIRIQVHANKYISPKVAVYLREVQPLNITALLQEHDTEVAKLTEQVRVLRDALTKLLRHTNSIEVLGEWSATDTNISSGKKLRAEVDACIKEARAALTQTQGEMK